MSVYASKIPLCFLFMFVIRSQSARIVGNFSDAVNQLSSDACTDNERTKIEIDQFDPGQDTTTTKPGFCATHKVVPQDIGSCNNFYQEVQLEEHGEIKCNLCTAPKL